MSQSLPCSHSSKTSLPQRGSHRITVLSDKGHWDAAGTAGALLFLFSWTRPFPWLEAAVCSSICMPRSRCVFLFQGRTCLYLHLSNSKLLASSGHALVAAVKEELSTGINGAPPLPFSSMLSVIPTGGLAAVTAQESHTSCFAHSVPPKPQSAL